MVVMYMSERLLCTIQINFFAVPLISFLRLNLQKKKKNENRTETKAVEKHLKKYFDNTIDRGVLKRIQFSAIWY